MQTSWKNTDLCFITMHSTCTETVIRLVHGGERGGGGSGVGWAEADPVPAIVSPHPIRLLMTLPNIILIISNMKVFVDFEEKQDESCWQSYM